MDPAVWIALIALCASSFGALATPWVTAWAVSKGKAEDWRRQDKVAERVDAAALRAEEVAAKAAEAAALLLERDERQAEEAEAARVAAVEVARLAAEARASTDSQLRQIHTLVNSEYTAARSDLLAQTKLTLATLRHVVELDRHAGREPSAEDVAAIAEAEQRITELSALLADRLAQQRIVEAEQAAASREAHE